MNMAEPEELFAPPVMIPRRIFENLQGYEFAVVAVLCEHWQGQAGGIEKRQKEIAAKAGISLSATKRCLDSLKKKGLIDWRKTIDEEGGTGPNIYHFLGGRAK